VGTASYATDLNDEEWDLIRHQLPVHKRCRPRKHAARVIINAILYLLRSGGSWASLPKGFPPHKTVYGQFQRWAHTGVFDRLLKILIPLARKKGGSPKHLKRLLSIHNPRPVDAMASRSALTGTRKSAGESVS
jgi:transposase